MPRSNRNRNRHRHRHLGHRRPRPLSVAAALLPLSVALLLPSSSSTSSWALSLTLPSLRLLDGSGGGDGGGRRRRETSSESATRVHSSVGGWTDESDDVDDGSSDRSSSGGPGLWKMMRTPFLFNGNGGSSYRGSSSSSGSGSGSSDGRRGRSQRPSEEGRRPVPVPFGPVPRGGSLSDISVTMPPSSSSSSYSSSAASASASASATLERQPCGPLQRVRWGARGVRRRIVTTAVNLNGVLRFKNDDGRQKEEADNGRAAPAAASASMAAPPVDNGVIGIAPDRDFGGHRSVLRVGGAINRRLMRRRRADGVAGATASPSAAVAAIVSDSAAVTTRIEAGYVIDSDAADDTEAWASLETALDSSSSPSSSSLSKGGERRQREAIGIGAAYENAALSFRGGDVGTMAATSSPYVVSSSANEMTDSYYVIETPLFPIILPGAWRPPPSAPAPESASTSMAAAGIAGLEISVALREEVSSASDAAAAAAAAADDAPDARPSPQLMMAATRPLLPADAVESFTGREFHYPETVEALAETGLRMTLLGADGGNGNNNGWVDWSGEKKTENFLRKHGGNGMRGEEWFEALDSSREVLVWAGRFTAAGEGYGKELPVIRTTSIIDKSPRYLAELLMDSSRVKAYNKMSLGRTDVRVFQTGIDTQGGAFGDGESKVVRNLTKPPMVSSIIEFVTCMHARRLRPSDADALGVDGDGDAPSGGYLVVSRAVTGGDRSAADADAGNGDQKLVRNEILMGVNVLRAVPGHPDKTELTSVTHAYSSLIPTMLAKGAGVKGAVDFVRDIRALP